MEFWSKLYLASFTVITTDNLWQGNQSVEKKNLSQDGFIVWIALAGIFYWNCFQFCEIPSTIASRLDLKWTLTHTLYNPCSCVKTIAISGLSNREYKRSFWSFYTSVSQEPVTELVAVCGAFLGGSQSRYCFIKVNYVFLLNKEL